MKTSIPFAIALALAVGVAAPAPSFGKDKAAEKRARHEAQQAALEALQRGEILPLARIMAIATETVPGDIIEIEYKAGPSYEVEVLTPTGRIREMRIDARTGEVLRIKEE